jgi:hypothetical protein
MELIQFQGPPSITTMKVEPGLKAHHWLLEDPAILVLCSRALNMGTLTLWSSLLAWIMVILSALNSSIWTAIHGHQVKRNLTIMESWHNYFVPNKGEGEGRWRKCLLIAMESMFVYLCSLTHCSLTLSNIVANIVVAGPNLPQEAEGAAMVPTPDGTGVVHIALVGRHSINWNVHQVLATGVLWSKNWPFLENM